MYPNLQFLLFITNTIIKWSYFHWNLCVYNNLNLCTFTYWIALLTKPVFFAISMKRETCATFFLFTVSLARRRCKKVLTCWIIPIRSRHLQINLLAWRYPWKNEDVVMILLKNLLLSYKYLITALETMSIKELTMKYMMKCLMYKLLKKKRKKKKETLRWWYYNGGS